MDMEDIRQPDQYKTEQLVGPVTRSAKKVMDELELAIQQSLLIYENDLFEKQQIEHIQREHELDERNRRKELRSKFTNIFQQLKRVSKYDKDIETTYTVIFPVIDMYCDGQIESCVFDDSTYDMIVKNLKTVRLKEGELDMILNILERE
jgi:hypothetical protein